MSDNTIVSCAIYPGIGIARVGNSPEFYFAPERPGVVDPVPGGFKDAKGRIKKQAAHFRIYGLNAAGEVVKQLSEDEADITWRVHVANRKAGWYQFNNAMDLEGLAIPSAPRNNDISGEDRKKLIIDPGQRSISGRNKSGKQYQFDSGEFWGTKVPLGEIRTDDKGNLIVLGGDGHSASYDGSPAVTFANNDKFHDDVSDGPVRATVIYQGTQMEAKPAMVAVTPPNFGQGLYGPVTMLDQALDVFIRKAGWLPAPKEINFWEHIYPIFDHLVGNQWVNEGVFFLFGQNSPSDYTQADLLEKLSDPSPAQQAYRQWIFEWFRDPSSQAYRPAQIPPFYGDAFGDYENLAEVGLPLLELQYGWMKLWAEGKFSNKKLPKPSSFAEMKPAEQADSLNRAALDEMLGGPFHPGIELTWPLRNQIFWAEPFRPNILPEGEETRDDYGVLLAPKIALGPDGPIASSGPGSLTRWMGVPWQTDEASCLNGYDPSTYLPLPSFWAARVPNEMLPMDAYKRLMDTELNTAQRLKHFDYRLFWLRDINTDYTYRINHMIEQWHQLGIAVEHPGPKDANENFLPERIWVETGREGFITADPTYQQVLRAEQPQPSSTEANGVRKKALKAHPDFQKGNRKRRTLGRHQK